MYDVYLLRIFEVKGKEI